MFHANTESSGFGFVVAFAQAFAQPAGRNHGSGAFGEVVVSAQYDLVVFGISQFGAALIFNIPAMCIADFREYITEVVTSSDYSFLATCANVNAVTIFNVASVSALLRIAGVLVTTGILGFCG